LTAYPSSPKSWFGDFLDWVQGGLDAGGTVEPTPFCDIANAGICVARGQWVDAGLTISGVVPYFGDAGKAVKHARKLAEGTAEVADTVNDLNKAADLAGDLKNVPTPNPAARTRLPQDVNVNPVPPAAKPLNRNIGGSTTQNARVQRDAARLQRAGAQDVRINQQQVNAAGERVGINRPDLQYTNPKTGQRVYIEYERTGSTRGAGHQRSVS
jgi:hypothetical protein